MHRRAIVAGFPFRPGQEKFVGVRAWVLEKRQDDGDKTEVAKQELHDGLALEVTYAAAIAKRDSLAMQFPTILRG